MELTVDTKGHYQANKTHFHSHWLTLYSFKAEPRAFSSSLVVKDIWFHNLFKAVCLFICSRQSLSKKAHYSFFYNVCLNNSDILNRHLTNWNLFTTTFLQVSSLFNTLSIYTYDMIFLTYIMLLDFTLLFFLLKVS